MKGRKRLWSLLLAALLLAGCGGPAASGAVSLAEEPGAALSGVASAAISRPENRRLEDPFVREELPEGLEDWRWAYYEVAKEYLEGKDGYALSSVGLYQSGDRLPVLYIVCRPMEDKGGAPLYLLWQMKDGQAVLKDSLNWDTPAPIVFGQEPHVHEDGGFVVWDRTHYFKKDENGWSPLWEDYRSTALRPMELDTPLLYCYETDRTYTLAEYTVNPFIPEQNCYADCIWHVRFSQEENDNSRLRRLADRLLLMYQAPVPVEAPAWVSAYVQYIWQNMFWGNEVVRGGQAKLTQSVEGQEIVLYDGLLPGQEAPVCDSYAVVESPTLTRLSMRQGRLEVAGGSFDTYQDIVQDAYGKPLWKMHAGSNTTWFRLGAEGREFLFGTGAWLLHRQEAPYAYAGAEFKWYDMENGDSADNEKQADEWIQAQIPGLLASHGYYGAILPWPSTTYMLPACETWAELEAALIDIFCTHARMMGQWG